MPVSRGVQYFAYLKAVDSATNISSVIKSDGVEFDNVPPEIKSISPLFDSLQVNLLGHPNYTRPSVFNGWKVPEVLLSGNKEEITKWREKKSYEKTKSNRPDLLK